LERGGNRTEEKRRERVEDKRRERKRKGEREERRRGEERDLDIGEVVSALSAARVDHHAEQLVLHGGRTV
jgi:hypothetical protein